MAKHAEDLVISVNLLMVTWWNRASIARPLHGRLSVELGKGVGVGSVTCSRPLASSFHPNESNAPNSQTAAVAYFHKDGLMQT